jgi:hypothetical protein
MKLNRSWSYHKVPAAKASLIPQGLQKDSCVSTDNTEDIGFNKYPLKSPGESIGNQLGHYNKIDFNYKKSCLRYKNIRSSSYNEIKSVKKVRFDYGYNNNPKITAEGILFQVRSENQHLPKLFSQKKLYTPLSDHPEYEKSNDYFLKYFSNLKAPIKRMHRLKRLQNL